MNSFLNFFDRYKLGIVAAFAIFTGVFIYLQMDIYEQYFPIDPFADQPEVRIEEDQLEITPEDVMIEQNNSMDNVKNIARDRNDTRERSQENWDQNKSEKNVEQSVKDYEKKLFEEAGGAAKRQAISDEMVKRQKERSTTGNNNNAKKESSQKSGGSTAYAGNVMVDWALKGRNPHQNDNYWVRNPGYTCGYGSAGTITVHIKVNQNGDVISAVPTASSGSNQCMIEQAVAYAKKSRFNYSSSAPAQQEGTITYKFISQ